MKNTDKRIEKINKQIELLKQQKKEILKLKNSKAKENLDNLSASKKKHLIRLGKILDEAGIKTQKEAKELINNKLSNLVSETLGGVKDNIDVFEEEPIIKENKKIKDKKHIELEDELEETKKEKPKTKKKMK